MTMNKIKGLVFFDELQEDPEAAMAGIFCVMDKSRGGVGDNKINSLASPESKAHFPDKPDHLFFSILINIAIIPP
jgi:hypothetical protein